MKTTTSISIILFLLFFQFCGSKQDFKKTSATAEFNEISEEQAAGGKSGENTNNESEINKTDAPIVIERKIIKEGDLRFETSNRAETQKLIIKAVEECGAYISKDNIYDYHESIEHHITIRVPAEKFDYLLTKISASANKIDSKNISALDVTEEFVDIEARIKTKKELENKYKELLLVAKKVDEILQIEREIGNLRTDIEAIEGRLRYLKNKVSYSTLSVVFYEQTASSFSFNSKLGQSIAGGWKNLLWFIIGLTNIWPFVLMGILLIVYIRRRRRKRKQNAV